MSTNQVYQDCQDVTVHSTRDYAKFSFDPRNRPVNQDQLETLYDSIEKVNLLHVFPIVVDSKFTVYDGQHRLKVAEALGVPVYYIFDDKVSIDHVTMTTDAVAKWEGKDYLHRWCIEGKQDYLDLQKFWFSNKMLKGKPFLSLQASANLCHYGDRKAMNIAFRQGSYKCNDLPFAESVTSALRDWSEHVEFFNHATFINAISNLSGNRHYDHQQMMSKMQYMSTRMVKCPDTASYIALIDEIYNHRVHVRNRVTLRKLGSADADYRIDRHRKRAA